MLQLFRKYSSTSFLFLIGYGILLHLYAFTNPETYTAGPHGVLSRNIYQLIGQSGFIPDLAALILLLIQAYLVNELTFKFRLTYERSYFPAVFYILANSLFTDFLHLTPVLMANTFIIFSLFQLFSIHKQTKYAGELFNAGLFIGMACLFYWSSAIYAILIIFGINIVGRLHLKNLLRILVGFLVPLYLMGTLAYLQNRLAWFIEFQFADQFALFDINLSLNSLAYIKIAAFGFLLIFTVLSQALQVGRLNLQAQRNISVLNWMMLFSLFSICIQQAAQLDHAQLASVPMAIILAVNFLARKNLKWADALHLMFLVFVFILQFNPF